MSGTLALGLTTGHFDADVQVWTPKWRYIYLNNDVIYVQPQWRHLDTTDQHHFVVWLTFSVAYISECNLLTNCLTLNTTYQLLRTCSEPDLSKLFRTSIPEKPSVKDDLSASADFADLQQALSLQLQVGLACVLFFILYIT